MPTQRQRQVQELLIREISDIIRREVNDPRVGFVTITDAEVTPDLRNAHVFVSSIRSPEELAEALKGLNRAAGFIRGEFGKRANLRFTPTIEFRTDASIDRGSRIHELLASIRETESVEPGPPEAGGERNTDGE